MAPAKRGIQRKILFSTLLVDVLSVLLIMSITYLVGKYSRKRTIGDYFKGLGIQTSKKLEFLIQDPIMVGKTIASLEGVVSAARVSAAKYANQGASEVEDRLGERDRLWREGSSVLDRYVSDILFDSEFEKWTLAAAVPIMSNRRYLI